MSERLAATARFHGLLDRLGFRIGGPRVLADCHGRMSWPERGVYFFYEIGEGRFGSDGDPRVVRVGTHALTTGSRSSLWGRLLQHRGAAGSAGGNHRGSIFRLLVGVALARREKFPLPPSWGVGSDPGAAARRLDVDRAEVKAVEADLETRVSRYIGAMPLLWLKVGDRPGPDTRRGVIERNAIALLSSHREPAADPPSPSWLGRYSDRDRVRRSGLWNNNHVDETYDLPFLDEMEKLIEETG